MDRHRFINIGRQTDKVRERERERMVCEKMKRRKKRERRKELKRSARKHYETYCNISAKTTV